MQTGVDVRKKLRHLWTFDEKMRTMSHLQRDNQISLQQQQQQQKKTIFAVQIISSYRLR